MQVNKFDKIEFVHDSVRQVGVVLETIEGERLVFSLTYPAFPPSNFLKLNEVTDVKLIGQITPITKSEAISLLINYLESCGAEEIAEILQRDPRYAIVCPVNKEIIAVPREDPNNG